MRDSMTILLVLAVLVGWAPGARAAPGTPGVRPADGAVVRAFDPPAVRWAAGHRGVDLAAADGAEVRAPLDGTISYAAVLAGRPVLVVNHGATRSTFEPVVATVSVGTQVRRGEVIGHLVAGHDCPAPNCLHWGLIEGETYLDPLSLLRGEVRLLSDADAAAIRSR